MAVKQNPQKGYIMSGGEANIKSLAIIIPLAAVMVVGYSWIWGMGKSAADISYLFFNFKLLIIALIGGTLAHEILHALAWLKYPGKACHSALTGKQWHLMRTVINP